MPSRLADLLPPAPAPSAAFPFVLPQSITDEVAGHPAAAAVYDRYLRREAGSVVTPDEIRGWFAGPDERVAHVALRAFGVTLPTEARSFIERVAFPDAAPLLAGLAARAATAADRDGLLWTPFLDTVAGATRRHEEDARRASRGPYVLASQAGIEAPAEAAAILRTRVEQVRGWVRGQRDPGDAEIPTRLAALLRFWTPEIGEVTLESARVWGPTLWDAIATPERPNATSQWAALARNLVVTPEMLDAAMTSRLEAAFSRPWGEEEQRHIFHLGRGMAALAKEGWPYPPACRDLLFRTAEIQDEDRLPPRLARELLLEDPTLTAEELHRAIGTPKTARAHRLSVLHHPAVTPAHVAAMDALAAADPGYVDAATARRAQRDDTAALLNNHAYRRSPAGRATFEKSRSLPVVSWLAHDADLPDWPKHLRTLLKLKPAAAVEVIESVTPGTAVPLPTSLVTALLRLEDPLLRRRAQAALHRLTLGARPARRASAAR